MITRGFWKGVLLQIDNAKNISNPRYIFKERDRRDATENLIITIFVTPFLVIFDLILSPFELMYLIAYKILWKDLGGNKDDK